MNKLKEPYYYLNNKFVLKSEAKISILDIGLLRGYGVFEYLVTYNQKPFLLIPHLKRLMKSCKLIDLKIPWSIKRLENLAYKALRKNANNKEKSLRFLITGGISKDSITPAQQPNLAIIVEDRKKISEKLYKNGISVITDNTQRSLPYAKSTNYTLGIKAMKKAKKVGAFEVVYVDKQKDRIYECVTSNIFIVKDNIVYTPKLEVLEGITRKVVLNISNNFFTTIFSNITIKQLYKADEIFITASNKEILPVIKVDNIVIGNGKPGIVTKTLLNEYRKFISENT